MNAYSLTSDRVEIPRKRWLLGILTLLPILSGVLFFAIGFAPLLQEMGNKPSGAEASSSGEFGVLYGLAALVVLSTVGSSFYFFKKWQSDEPGLVLDSNGIRYAGIGQKPLFVPWSQIERAEVKRNSNSEKVVFVFLNNPRAFIAKQEGGWNRFQMRLALLTSKTPIVLQTGMLAIRAIELQKLISARAFQANQKPR